MEAIFENLNPTYSFVFYSLGLIIFSSVGMIAVNSCQKEEQDDSLLRLTALEHLGGVISSDLQILKNRVQKIEDCIIDYESN